MNLSAAERDRLAVEFAALSSQAGVAVMEVFNSDFETRTKSDHSPVSDADERAEEIILAGLARLLPGVPVLAEETASRDGVAAGLGDLFLLVDPVDGTRDFVERRKDFTVNIALVQDRRPVAGCVYAPARLDMYFGGASARFAGDFHPGADVTADTGTAIRVRPRPAEGLTAVTSHSHLDAETKAFLARLPIASSTGIGSSLKFCLLARGAADIYPRFGPTMEWDTAAGDAVLRAAGGRVETPAGELFVYGKSDAGYLNGAFIAWGGD